MKLDSNKLKTSYRLIFPTLKEFTSFTQNREPDLVKRKPLKRKRIKVRQKGVKIPFTSASLTGHIAPEEKKNEPTEMKKPINKS